MSDIVNFVLNNFVTIIELIVIVAIVLRQGLSTAARVEKAMEEPTKKVSESVASVNTAIDRLAGVLEYMSEANKRLVGDNAVLAHRADQAEKTAKELEGRIETYTKAMNDQLADRAQDSKLRDEKLSALETQIQQVSTAQKETEGTLEKTNGELKDVRAAHIATLEELEKTKRELASALRRIEDLERQRDDERKTAESEKLALEKALTAEREKVVHLEEQVRTLENRVKELESQQQTASKPPEPPTSAG